MQDEFGEKLKALRKERRLTREVLAAQLGISARQLQRYEEGDSKPEVDGIRRLSEALGYDFAPHFFKTLGVSSKVADGMISMPAAQRIDELLSDKKVLQETIAANLQTLHASQDVLLMTVRSVYEQTAAIRELLEAPQTPGTGSTGDRVAQLRDRGRKN